MEEMRQQNRLAGDEQKSDLMKACGNNWGTIHVGNTACPTIILELRCLLKERPWSS
jgi:hypothetical protein